MKRFRLAVAAAVILAMFFPGVIALPQELPKIALEKYTLPNGLQVILHEDHSTPIVAVNLWYHVGSKNEKPGKTGFAHLFEHIMFQGSEHQPGEYFAPLEKIGGSANGTTSEDRTNYFEVVPSNYLELALWLESDRMGFLLPALTQEKLDNQRDVVKNERRQKIENQPYGRSEEVILSALYPPDHPYSWIVFGSQEDLSNAALEDVKAFFKEYYTPNNASLVIAGDFDPAEAKRLVNKYFADIPAGPHLKRLEKWVPKLDAEKRFVMEDRVSLPRLYMAWHTPPYFAPDDAELDILANILTAGKTSRLYKSLVYEKQIAQDINAYQASKEIASSFRIVATAKPGHTLEELEAAIDHELKQIQERPPTSEEMRQAKNTWEATFVRSIQNLGGSCCGGGKADQLNAYNVYVGTPDYFQQDLNRYLKVTPAEVQRVAKTYLDLDRRVVLQVVPREEAKEKIEATVERSVQPAAGPEPEFRLPDFQRRKLSNGLEVIVAEHHELPMVDMVMVIKAGWAADPKGKQGTASLTSALQDEGTKTRTALQISEELKKIGAQMSTTSFFDASFVTLNTLKKHLDAALNIYADVLINPTFPKDELERQRKIYLARILQEQKQPTTSAFKVFLRTLYGADHPYGQPFTGSGTEESIKALTTEDLVTFYDTYYHPNNATLVVVGDVTSDEMVTKLETALKNWKPKPVPEVTIPAVKPLAGTQIYLVDKPDAAQSVIVCGNLGIERRSPDYYKVLVMNNILGGQFMSRLNLNLREAKGYSYGAGSSFLDTKAVGPFIVSASVHTQFTKESIVELLKELRGIAGERAVTSEELADSKNNLRKGYPQGFETSGQVAWQLAQMVQFELPDNYFEQFVPSINAVTAEEVATVARKYIRTDDMVVVVVGDLKKIESGIRELQLGPIAHFDAQQGNVVAK